jgi:hypothetical protein
MPIAGRLIFIPRGVGNRRRPTFNWISSNFAGEAMVPRLGYSRSATLLQWLVATVQQLHGSRCTRSAAPGEIFNTGKIKQEPVSLHFASRIAFDLSKLFQVRLSHCVISTSQKRKFYF